MQECADYSRTNTSYFFIQVNRLQTSYSQLSISHYPLPMLNFEPQSLLIGLPYSLIPARYLLEISPTPQSSAPYHAVDINSFP